MIRPPSSISTPSSARSSAASSPTIPPSSSAMAPSPNAARTSSSPIQPGNDSSATPPPPSPCSRREGMDSLVVPTKPSLAALVGRLIHLICRKKNDRDLDASSDGIRILSLDVVKEYMDGFHEDNFLGETESSISWLYVGTIVESDEDGLGMSLWRHGNGNYISFRTFGSHPNVVKLYGCFESEELLGLVYDYRALDTLRTMIDDESFTWRMRIKSALGVARVINLLYSQNPPLLVHNLEPGSILHNHAWQYMHDREGW